MQMQTGYHVMCLVQSACNSGQTRHLCNVEINSRIPIYHLVDKLSLDDIIRYEFLCTFLDLGLHKYTLSDPKAREFPSGEIVRTFGRFYEEKESGILILWKKKLIINFLK